MSLLLYFKECRRRPEVIQFQIHVNMLYFKECRRRPEVTQFQIHVNMCKTKQMILAAH